MTIEQFVETHYLLPEVLELVHRVAKVSGKEIEIIEDQNAPYPAMIEMARREMPRHLFIFHPEKVDRLNYYLAYKCLSILRVASADPSLRRYPASTHGRVDETIQRLKENADGPMSVTDQTLRMWIVGAVLQLANLPADIHIERRLHALYRSLQSEQKAHITEDTSETDEGLSREIERLAPEPIFIASTAMAYAYLRAVGELTGANYTKPFYDFAKALRRGKELYAMLGEDRGLAGDHETITRWAEYLGITDWFEWRDMEDMPMEYKPQEEATAAE